jgi:hypothetical protein
VCVCVCECVCVSVCVVCECVLSLAALPDKVYVCMRLGRKKACLVGHASTVHNIPTLEKVPWNPTKTLWNPDSLYVTLTSMEPDSLYRTLTVTMKP